MFQSLCIVGSDHYGDRYDPEIWNDLWWRSSRRKQKGDFMSEAKWYVVHTYSGYENKVKANIDKTIENRHLEDQILEVRVPLEAVIEMKTVFRK